MSPDLGARLLLMSAYLYYRRHSLILEDTQYDKLCRGIIKRWDMLDDFRQWQIGAPEFPMGQLVKVTMAVEQGALAWHKSLKGDLPHGKSIGEDEWRWSPKRQVHWVRADA